MKLYTYFRSSAAYRVRIALNLKGLTAELIPVHLVRNGGEHLTAQYKDLNPNAVVPTLVDHGTALTQSIAIIEYLDEVYPAINLLPKDPIARAQIRAIALTIACDIHPLQNLRVLNYLGDNLSLSDEQKKDWYRHWVSNGLSAVESMVTKLGNTPFCYGDTATLADICLIPQLFNARRVKTDLSSMPNLLRIEANCEKLSAFQLAAPAKQADFE